MRTRRPVVLLLALLAFVLAGCGGGAKSSSSTGGGSTPEGAKLVRAGVLAFVAIDSDLSSGQWQQLDTLSHKFPGRDKAIAQLKRSLTQHGVDYDRDVKPALGPEVDIAVSGTSRGSTNVVALTKPDDPARFKALVAKLNASDSSGDRAVYRQVDDWYALSNSQAAIDDVVKTSGTTLDADQSFSAALDKLPGDALVKAYVDGQQLNALVGRASAQSGSKLGASALGLDKLQYVAASASAEDDGVRVRGASKGASPGGGDFSSTLMDGVPDDAFAFLTIDGKGTSDQLEALKSNPQVGRALAQMQAMLGVSFEQVLALLRGEIAFYARPGIGIPELTLVLEEQDESAALATLDKLAARLAARSGGKVVPGQQGGHDVKTIDLGRFAIHYGAVDGKIVLTSGVSGIADYGGSGDHLADSADFKDAKAAAGLPDSNGGFIYLDLKDALPMLEGLAGLAGRDLPAELTDNLRPLRSLLAWSAGSGDTRTYDAFLEIK